MPVVLTQPEGSRQAQRRAATPGASAWVAASAGAGKTKVLTDRVLRLLLPRADGAAGTPPHKILCLTFTKTAAGEMALRLRVRLAHWAAGRGLAEDLDDLLGHPPTPEQAAAARGLLMAVLDAPGGLNILTIHAFCQSVLARFSLEAGLTPGFTALDEAAAGALLTQAREEVLRAALAAPGSPAHGAFMGVAAHLGEAGFTSLIRALAAERGRLATMPWGPEALRTALAQAAGAPVGEAPGQIVSQACQDASLDAPVLRAAAETLIAQGTDKTDQPRGRAIAAWLAAPEADRAGGFDAYCGLFLTQKNAIRDRLATKGAAEALPALKAEAARLEGVRAALRAAKCATASADLLILSEAILARYGALKAAQGALDFDDMILKTLALLEKAPGWVQYKLDQGIDHILVDEAQDTNPEQWRILAALAGEFFAGAGARAAHRTVFAVGDVKQSIYGFQRAAPEAFAQMRASLAARAADAGGAWEDVALDLSFRSAPAILRSVDAVCAGLDMGTDAPAHRAHRADAGGVVEVWPLLEPDAGAATEEGEEAEGDLWDPPLRALEARSGAEKMAARVAEKVCQWLQSKEIVPSTGAPTRPGDILVLLRKRGALAPLVTRALKRAGVPVGGADRLVLTEHLAVQDLIAAARFALLPGDDLSLACLLRSPLIGWGEGALFRVAHGRTGALWEALPQDAYLQGLVDAAPGASPFVFFSGILEAPCPADPGGSGWRALAARLGADAREPLEAFLAQALAFGAGPLEAFLAGLEAGQGGEVKRETEGAAGHVRVMTVHGAKGLQAPIVVLPDTVVTQKAGVAKAESRLMWTEAGLPLWSPGPDTECAAFDALRLRQAETQAREEARAAYVAMTRAQDRLYIGGYTGKRAPQEDSWYFAMRRGVKGLAGTKALPDGTLRLADVGTAEPQAAQGHRAQLPESYGLPPWARAPAPAEALGGPPLYPSRLAEDEDEEEVAAPSPLLAAGRGAARTRGDVTHALFQLLPALDPAARATAAAAYARAHGAGADVAQEVLGVIQDPRFADVFGPGSLAEVAVAGTLPDGRALSGRIDRLLVEPGRVTIVDFKTGRPPGDSGPAPLYKRQMAAYAALVSQLYPGRAVRCVLLYTQGPEWVEL